MKVGVRTTPAAGTPAAELPPIPPPSLKTLAPVRRSSASFRPPPAAVEDQPAGARTRTMVIGGLCMIAFSCGVMCTIAVDRFWPHARPQCAGAEQASMETVPSGAVGPAGEPAAVEVTPLPPADPNPVVQAESAPPVPVAPAAAAPGAVPAPAAVVAVPQAPAPRAARTAGSARVPPAQGRASLRKRGTGAATSTDTMPPTGTWVDPFAQ